MSLAGLRHACAAAVLTVLAGGPGNAQSFNQFFGFGDSTIDSGWYKSALPNSTNAVFNRDFAIAVNQGAGVATTSPGLVSAQYLAGRFGLDASPANQPGGTDYATGGARDAAFNVGFGNQGAVPTVTQVNNYLGANGGVANGNALYLISSGGNDILYATGNLPAAAQSAYVATAADALVGGITRLAQAGARYILVPDQPQSFFGNAASQALAASYNSTHLGRSGCGPRQFYPGRCQCHVPGDHLEFFRVRPCCRRRTGLHAAGRCRHWLGVAVLGDVDHFDPGCAERSPDPLPCR